MNIFTHRISIELLKNLTKSQPYLFCSYIHLKDHEQRINPKESRLNLSYMNPNKIVQSSLKNERYTAKLRRATVEHIQRRLFEQYKNKILEGKVDEQLIAEPDVLWGSEQKPVHYYQALSATQATRLSHSVLKDIQHHQNQIVQKYFESIKKISNVSQAKDVNELAQVAVNYRLNGVVDRQKYFQIQHLIGNKFHQLTTKSLIYLKYAFLTSPKKSTPEFNKIINDLLVQSIKQISLNDLIHLMYFNRFDHFRFHTGNLQIYIIQQISKHFKQMNLQQKIDFFFLYVESRGPTIRSDAKDRNVNEIRNKTQHILYFLNLDANFSQVSELSVLKLAYSLVRTKTIATDYLTEGICDYISQNMNKIQKQNLILFFIYLSKVEGNKSISNIDLMKQLKQKVINYWGQYSQINKIRALDSMQTLNLYDEATHQLYSAIPITADSSLLGHFCRIQMMNTSGRQWEVIHRLVDLQVLPMSHFQDYKRFYNYVRWTAPDWDLTPLQNKLVNSQCFFDSLREQSFSLEKRYYRQIKQFHEFSGLKCLPKPFKMGQPIHNIQFAEFQLNQYLISLDIITDVERIRGTRDLKGSYQIKIKSLQSLGWKHLYVFEQDIKNMRPLEFFDYIYSLCEPHFESQIEVIKAQEQILSDKLEGLRLSYILASMPGPEIEQMVDTQRTGIVIAPTRLVYQKSQNQYESRRQRMKI